jgi:8-oxo-dGTP diphosphatase
MTGNRDDELRFLAGYDASRYPRPSVAVDVVLLTVHGDGLQTLLVRRDGQPQKVRWALPGGFVQMDESLDDAARRVLALKAGLDGVFIEQVYTFGEPRRDPRTRVISVVYLALVEAGRLRRAVDDRADHALGLATVECSDDGAGTAIAVARDAAGTVVPLAFDHAAILGRTVERVRGKLAWAPIGFELLPATFTLRDLRLIHEGILGRPLNKDSFRRRMLDQGLVEPTGELLRGTGHRPAELYRLARERAPG